MLSADLTPDDVLHCNMRSWPIPQSPWMTLLLWFLARCCHGSISTRGSL